jgi:hypothetical protein
LRGDDYPNGADQRLAGRPVGGDRCPDATLHAATPNTKERPAEASTMADNVALSGLPAAVHVVDLPTGDTAIHHGVAVQPSSMRASSCGLLSASRIPE